MDNIMELIKDVFQKENIEFEFIEHDSENIAFIYNFKNTRNKMFKIANIISDETLSTIVTSDMGNIPFYKKIEALDYLNKKNLEEDEIKFRISEENKIVFSIDRVLNSPKDFYVEVLKEDREKIINKIDEYTILDEIVEKFSKRKDINSLLNFNKVEPNISIYEKTKEYLKSKSIKPFELTENNKNILSFKVVNESANAKEVEVYIDKKDCNHTIKLINIFGSLPSESIISTLEALGDMNNRNKEMKFIYTHESNSFDVIINYTISVKLFDEEKLFDDIIKYSNLTELEYKKFIAFMTDTVNELLIETPEQ